MSGGARPTGGSVALGVVGLAVVVVVVDAVNDAVGGNAVTGLGVLVLAGVVCGRAMAFFGLPRLTGYLFAGIALGPQALDIVSLPAVKALGFVNTLALALIALQAGAELTLSTLARTARSVLWSSALQVLIVVSATAVCFFALRPWLPFVANIPAEAAWVWAIMWGVLALTRSPAGTLAVLAETRARGPVADFSLGIVVVLDVLVLPLFALALALARAQLNAEAFGMHALTHLGFELFASVCMGVTLGLTLLVTLKLVTRERLLVVVALAYGVTALSNFLHYDTLFVFVVAGFVVANVLPLFGVRNVDRGHELIHVLESLAQVVMVVFFATAGAQLNLDALRTLWPVALALALARTVATVLACRLAHRIAGDDAVVTRFGHTSLVSQAGVTIGLVGVVSALFPGVGDDFATLCIAVIGIHQVVGPLVFAWGLRAAGEVPKTSGGDGEARA